MKDSVEAFRLARHCCSFVAQQIQLDTVRGTPDIPLQEGHYYQDYAGRQFRFCGTVRDDGNGNALTTEGKILLKYGLDVRFQ